MDKEREKLLEKAVFTSLEKIKNLQAENKTIREQLDKYKAKDLLDEIHTNYMRYHAENYDTKDFVINLACGSVVVMDKQGYQNLLSVREQLIQELKEWVKENHYTQDFACFDTVEEQDLIDTHKILAKLDLLEKGGK
jgi:Fe2+ or Zn2+ uptake regulation protein